MTQHAADASPAAEHPRTSPAPYPGQSRHSGQVFRDPAAGLNGTTHKSVVFALNRASPEGLAWPQGVLVALRSGVLKLLEFFSSEIYDPPGLFRNNHTVGLGDSRSFRQGHRGFRLIHHGSEIMADHLPIRSDGVCVGFLGRPAHVIAIKGAKKIEDARNTGNECRFGKQNVGTWFGLVHVNPLSQTTIANAHATFAETCYRFQDPDPLEPWLISEQEWVLIPVTPVEPDEEPKPEGD